MLKKIKVSIIIVHYQKKKILFDCLNSLLENKPKPSFEVLVVDNDESKTLKEHLLLKFPWVKYLASRGNLGYGAANNLGAQKALGDYLFIVNPDTLFLPGTVDSLVNYLDKHKDTAVVSPQYLDKQFKAFKQLGTGKLTPLTAIVSMSLLDRLWPKNRVSKNYWLRDVDLAKTRLVATFPGSAFLIRKTVFRKIGGFDENFFLYFEENDLSRQINKLGLKMAIYPKSKIIHLWAKIATPTKERKEIFTKSRFYYFRKHFGLVSAFLVHLLTSVSKWHLLMFFILSLGVFLRFFRYPDNFIFSGELGDNLLDIKDAILTGKWPLYGPPTSHPWLFFGPFYYWLMIPVVKLFGFEPIVAGYFGVTVGSLGIVLNYWVVRKLYSQPVAVLSSFLISVSPLWLSHARNARFYFIAGLLVYPFAYLVSKITKGHKNLLFCLGLTYGLMLNFHYSSLLLLPVIVYLVFLKRRQFKPWHLVIGWLGLLIPLTPILIRDLGSGFQMTKNFLLWVPYRLFGFIGLLPQNHLSSDSLKQSLSSLSEFVGCNFTNSQVFWWPLTLIVLVLVILGVIKSLRKSETKTTDFFLYVSFIVAIIGVVIHGGAPVHYFLPIFWVPITVVSKVIVSFFSHRRFKTIVFSSTVCLLVLFEVVNVLSLRVLYQHHFSDSLTLEPYFSPLGLQKEVAREIIKRASGRPYSLLRVGPDDQFEENYSQNYRYLLWLLGNEPKSGEKLKLTVYEDTSRVDKNSIIWLRNVGIKEEK